MMGKKEELMEKKKKCEMEVRGYTGVSGPIWWAPHRCC